MNPGSLENQINILALKKKYMAYLWASVCIVSAKIEQIDRTNLFSQVGIGAKSVKFTIRECGLTLHHVIRWQGDHYFITDIKAIDRLYCEVTTARIKLQTCIATRNVIAKDKLNRPTSSIQAIATFPACLVEKYMGFQQQKPQAVNELTYVLITPKVIELQAADLVKIGDDTFNVQIVHCLDEYKNEYEINIIKEA